MGTLYPKNNMLVYYCNDIVIAISLLSGKLLLDMQTAVLAQKNSEATRVLALQTEILEKELGEIQMVLLAMQVRYTSLVLKWQCWWPPSYEKIPFLLRTLLHGGSVLFFCLPLLFVH